MAKRTYELKEKVLRFSELTPEKIGAGWSIKIDIPRVHAFFRFDRNPFNAKWEFRSRSEEPLYGHAVVEPVHYLDDGEVFTYYAALVLTLCRLVGVTYDDVRVTYQWAPRMVKEEK